MNPVLIRAVLPMGRQPGQWMPHMAGYRKTARVKCEAGHETVLDSHSTTVNGEVEPAVECSAPCCDWTIERVVLQDWASRWKAVEP